MELTYEIIKLGTLENIVNFSIGEKRLVLNDLQCVICGSRFAVTVDKTSGGFGFLNGALLEPTADAIQAVCSKCAKGRL
jgi:hypothetical protein